MYGLLTPQRPFLPIGTQRAGAPTIWTPYNYFGAAATEVIIPVAPNFRFAEITGWGGGGGARCGVASGVCAGGYGKVVLALPSNGCSLYIGVAQGGNTSNQTPGTNGSGAATGGAMPGGAGGSSPGGYSRGGGGGASYVGINGNAAANIGVVFGGAGGDWAGGGGAGGGPLINGADGTVGGTAAAGKGGTQTAGGAGGAGAASGSPGTTGTQFAGGTGGAGQAASGRAGAGGGGGWWGGGGGGGGDNSNIEGSGGAGGSGYFNPTFGGYVITASLGLPAQADPLWNGVWGIPGTTSANGGQGQIIIRLGA